MPIFASLSSNVLELWCNGNTADFGSVVQGSNPCSSTSRLNEGRGRLRTMPSVRDEEFVKLNFLLINIVGGVSAL